MRKEMVGVVIALAVGTPAWAATDPLRSHQWNLDLIHADEAHRISEGADTLVAVVDSGVDMAHPDLAGSVVAGPDFVDGDSDPTDLNGHGTHVAGIIAAHAGNGQGVEGAAPAATILAIRVLDASNRGTTAQAAKGIDAAIAAGAQVVNLSLTAGPDAPERLLPTSDLTAAIQRAVDAGIIVTAAAGNDALPICEQPVIQGRILCVGAVGRGAKSSSFSNYGLRVDVVAPGGEPTSEDAAVTSTVPGGGYAGMAGTSQASPHVAAAAALLVSLGLRGQQVIDRIEQTATDLGPPGQDSTYGYGLVDLAAAVAGLGPVQEPGARTAGATRLQASSPPRARIGWLLRRGLAVRCRLSTAERCTARVTTGQGTVLARGARRIAADRTTIVRARPTRGGRRILRRATRIRARVRVTTPGAPAVVRALVLVRRQKR